MKYIRTKENIIVDTTKYQNVVERTFNDKVVAIDLNHWGKDNGKYPTWIDVKDIVKQADTIEELCDWFVLRKDGKIYQMYAKEEYAVADLGQYSLAFEWVYAIETDKGLIYVAKMNDKGELELL